jgi:protoporphyrinogen oxidase
MKIGVLGGGLAGVSLAYFLKEKGYDVEVLEKESECGGLCRSFSKNGFSYDLGGHIIFSKDTEILDLMVGMLGNNVQKLYRNNKIWFKNRFVKYPFENGLAELDKEEIFECLNDFINNKHKKPKNFKEWIYYTFGDGLADKYLIPYNEKIWNCKAETMGLEWVERIPKPPVEDIIKSALGIETEGYTHQLYFYYPIKGGIQALVEAFETKLNKITFNFAVRAVKKIKVGKKTKWFVSDGKDEREYDRIVSCLPIFDLADALDVLPAKIGNTVRKLKYNSLSVVMLGIDRPDKSGKFAVYYPQKDLLFHRVCFHSYMGVAYAPKGRSLVVAEITTNEGDGIHEMPDRELVERISRGLAKEGFINKKDVCATDVKRMKYGYVVHDLNYGENTKLIKDYFRSFGIPLCGRFAEFEYLNMDAVVKHSKNLSNKYE